MKRLTIEGDWGPRDSSGGWVLWSKEGRMLAQVFQDCPNVTVEDVPDPLPSKPGTHIVATVTRGDESVRTVLALVPEQTPEWAKTWPWRSVLRVDGESWHGPEHLSDWRVLDVDDGVAP